MTDRQIEVSHEALIRGWPTLRQWIDQDRAGQRSHRQISDATREWYVTRDSGILYRGLRLAQALEWRKSHEPALNEQERAFLDTSVRRKRLYAFGFTLIAILGMFIAYTVVAEWVQQAARLEQLSAETESAKASSKELVAEAEKLKARLDLAQSQFRNAAPASEDTTKLREEIATLKTKLSQAVGENEKLRPSNNVSDTTLTKEQSAALIAAAPYVKLGFQVRDDYWGGALKLNEKKAIRQNLFKGNEYWFWMGTSAPKARLSVHIYDSEGKLAETESWQGKTAAARIVPKFAGSASGGSYFIIVEVEESSEDPTLWALTYGFK